ncbi:MAG: hypothetical protein M1609_17010, partial [Firmicutes bacterium]|nr:hypothetical protein [Bacillota bacterium]
EEKMAGADRATRIELSKKVYGQLTPQQVQALISRENDFVKGGWSGDSGGDRGDITERRKNNEDRHDRDRREFGEGKGVNKILEQSLPDVTIKMLKDRSAERSQ